MKPLALLSLLVLCSCSSVSPKPAAIPHVIGPVQHILLQGLEFHQLSPSGVHCISASGLSKERIQTIDDKVLWCIAHGLQTTPYEVAVYVKDPNLFDSEGRGWLANTDGSKMGGITLSFSPIVILVMPQQLGCIRHELLHVHLKQTTGDSDTHHTGPLWNVWPTYEQT